VPATCQRAMTKQHASGDFSMKQPSTSNHGQASQKKSHVSDETDATEETREIVGVWNQGHERAPEKGHRRRWPAGQTFLATEKRKRNQTRGGPVNMGWRWRGDGAARIRPPCEPRVCSWCPRLAASPPAHRLRSSIRTRYASHQTAPVPASTPSCSRPWRQSHACRLSRDHSPCRICRLLVC